MLGNAISTYLKITTARLKFKGIGGTKNLPWNMAVNLIPHIETYQHMYQFLTRRFGICLFKLIRYCMAVLRPRFELFLVYRPQCCLFIFIEREKVKHYLYTFNVNNIRTLVFLSAGKKLRQVNMVFICWAPAVL